MSKFMGKDQNWADGTTTYWFDVDGEQCGVVESECGASFVDCDGCTIDDGASWSTMAAVRDLVVTDEMRAA